MFRRLFASAFLVMCAVFNGPVAVNEGNVPENERPVINETNVLPGTWFHADGQLPCS